MEVNTLIWIVQKNEYGMPTIDVGREVFEEASFQNWKHGREINQVYLEGENIPRIGTKECAIEQSKNRETAFIPIGTIEFVEYHLGHHIAPINIPQEMISNTKIVGDRIVGRGTYEELREVFRDNKNKRFFIKSDTMVKGFDSIFLKYNSISYLEGIKLRENSVLKDTYEKAGYSSNKSVGLYGKTETRYFYSEYIKIASEWRVFVYNGIIKDVKQYVGSWDSKRPNKENIEYIIAEFEKLNTNIKAYTVDVAVTESGETILIEIHNFVACGLYGFEGNRDILKMLKSGYKYEEQVVKT